MRKALNRVLLVLLGTVLGLLSLELTLQLGALVIRFTHASGSAYSPSTVGRWLALGDSNTYGLYLTRNQSYPGVLQNLLQQQPNAGQVEIVNLGYPGCNSSRLRRLLPRLLDTFAPDVVTIMVGANDFWTVPDPIGAESWPQYFWRLSRVYRLAFMTWRALRVSRMPSKNEVEVSIEEGPPDLRHPEAGGQLRNGNETFDLSWRAGGNQQWERDLYDNLEVMARDVRDHGAKLMLLTYAAEDPIYGAANAVIRSAARASGTPLIDTAPVFAPHCPQWQCDDLLFADHHPTAEGHQLIARTILQSLLTERAIGRVEAR